MNLPFNYTPFSSPASKQTVKQQRIQFAYELDPLVLYFWFIGDAITTRRMTDNGFATSATLNVLL